jgi:hypothetical protein
MGAAARAISRICRLSDFAEANPGVSGGAEGNLGPGLHERLPPFRAGCALKECVRRFWPRHGRHFGQKEFSMITRLACGRDICGHHHRGFPGGCRRCRKGRAAGASVVRPLSCRWYCSGTGYRPTRTSGFRRDWDDRRADAGVSVASAWRNARPRPDPLGYRRRDRLHRNAAIAMPTTPGTGAPAVTIGFRPYAG